MDPIVMSRDEPIPLDRIANISLDLDKSPLKNLHALNYLTFGLFSLACSVKVEEGKWHKRCGNVCILMLDGQVDPRLPCVFDWFAVSLINYVRLVGFIGHLGDNGWSFSDMCSSSQNRKNIKVHCSDYCKSVLPALYQWRNKVSAHFAITDPQDDNLGTLEQSVMNSLGYFPGRFRVGSFQWSTHGEKSELPEWSLTEVYEGLIARYWPDARISFDPQEARPPAPVIPRSLPPIHRLDPLAPSA